MSSSQTVKETVNDTVEDALPKLAKLQQAKQAVFLEDFRALAADERESVRKYKDKTLFGGSGSSNPSQEGDMGNITIADNVSINEPTAASQSKSNPWATAALVGAGILGGGGLGMAGMSALSALQQPVNEVVQPATTFSDVDTDTRHNITFGGDYEIVK